MACFWHRYLDLNALGFFLGSSLFGNFLYCSNKNFEEPLKPILNIDGPSSRARIFFRKHQYEDSLKALEGVPEIFGDNQWIMAENYFRLGKYKEAKKQYEILRQNVKSILDKRKVEIRLFDIAINDKNLQEAIDQFVLIKKQFKRVPDRLIYALGKALFDAEIYEKSSSLLKGIKNGTEFSMRAKYLLATLDLKNNKKKTALLAFKTIQKMKSISVEDYAVLELAKLAEARIYNQEKRYELAKNAYEKVLFNSSYNDIATVELVLMLLGQATDAKNAFGPYKKLKVSSRIEIENKAILEVAKAYEKYNLPSNLSSQKLDIINKLGLAYAYNKRYIEARKVYDDIINFYKNLIKDLEIESNKELIWDIFSLDNYKNLIKKSPIYESIYAKIEEVKTIDSIRQKIKDDDEKLLEINELISESNKADAMEDLNTQKIKQEKLKELYNKVVLKTQKEIKRKMVILINNSIAQAEYNRAKIPIMEIDEIKKQLDTVRTYQTKELQLFEKNLQKMENGG